MKRIGTKHNKQAPGPDYFLLWTAEHRFPVSFSPFFSVASCKRTCGNNRCNQFTADIVDMEAIGGI